MCYCWLFFIVFASCFEDASDSPAKAAADSSEAGSFTKLTHAAEALASHAASQAAGLFSYKKAGEEKSQDLFVFLERELFECDIGGHVKKRILLRKQHKVARLKVCAMQ